MNAVEQRRPTMAEQQAVTAFGDAVRRMRLRGLDVQNFRGDDDHVDEGDMCLIVTHGDYITDTVCCGIETDIQACFDKAARWLEERESELIGVPDHHELLQLSASINDHTPKDHQALLRSLKRFDCTVWQSLDWAYLHRIFMWPDVASQQPNRHERRAFGKR